MVSNETSISILFKLDSPIFNRLYYSNVQVNQLVKLLHNPLSLVNPFRKLLMKYDNQTKYLNMFQVIKPNDECKIYLKLNNIVSRNDSNNTQPGLENLADNVIVDVQEVVSQFRAFMLSSYSIQLENYSIISNYINTIIIFDNYYTSISTVYNLVVDFISAKRYNYIMFDLTIYPLCETVTIPLINQSESKNNQSFRYYLKSSVNSNESNITLVQRELSLNSCLSQSCLICYIDNCKPLVIQLNPVIPIETLNIQHQLIVIPTVNDDIITRLMTTIREVMVIEDYEDELITYLSDYYDKYQTYIGCKYDIQLIKHILTSILLG